MCPYTVLTPFYWCRKKRQGRFSETDWRVTHIVHTGRWDTREPVPVEQRDAHDEAYFVEYLRWLQAHARVRLRPTADHRPISKVDSDEIDEYDNRTRHGVQPKREPIQDYVVRPHFCLLLLISTCNFFCLLTKCYLQGATVGLAHQ